MFREAGLDPEKPPATWQELVEYGKKLTKTDTSGKLVQTGYGLRYSGNPPGILGKFYPLLWSMGGEVINDDGESLITSEKTVNALQFYVDMVNKDKISSLEFPGPDDQFAEGLTAMYPREGWVINYLKTTYPDIEFGVADIPAWEGNRVTALYLSSVSVSAMSPNKEEAWKFLDYLFSQGNYMSIAKSITSLPWTEEMGKDPYYESPELQAFVRTVSYARVQYKYNVSMVEIMTIMAKAIEKALFQELSVEDALAEAESQIKPLLAK